jgi:hypothetical protein
MTGKTFEEVLHEIDGYLERRLEPMRALAADVVAFFQDAPDVVGEADLDGLVPGMQERLAADPAMIGYGFAAAPDVIRGRDRYLLWFQRRAAGIRRLNLNLADGDPELYDYFDTDWFGHAERDRRPAMYGPYVDYAGADFLVLTVAVPVLVGDRFVGVTGSDMDPGVVEGALVAMMRALPGEAVVVASDRSVIAAGSARWMPGERLAAHPAQASGEWAAVAPLRSWTGWTFALAAASR